MAARPYRAILYAVNANGRRTQSMSIRLAWRPGAQGPSTVNRILPSHAPGDTGKLTMNGLNNSPWFTLLRGSDSGPGYPGNPAAAMNIFGRIVNCPKKTVISHAGTKGTRQARWYQGGRVPTHRLLRETLAMHGKGPIQAWQTGYLCSKAITTERHRPRLPERE